MNRPMNLDEELAYWKDKAALLQKTNLEQKSAVLKFLDSQGNDLCHENRKELAAAFGLGQATPELVPECEFRKNCDAYANDLYKNAHGAVAQDWKQTCHDTVASCLEAITGKKIPQDSDEIQRMMAAYGEKKLSESIARIVQERRALLDAAYQTIGIFKNRIIERWALNVMRQKLEYAVNMCADAKDAVWRGGLPNDDGEEAFYFLVAVTCEPKTADFSKVYEWVTNRVHDLLPTAKLGIPGHEGSFYLNGAVVKALPRFEWTKPNA